MKIDKWDVVSYTHAVKIDKWDVVLGGSWGVTLALTIYIYIYIHTHTCIIHAYHTYTHAVKIDKWDVVLGGSWGVTLALAYAQQHPDAVDALVLSELYMYIYIHTYT